MKLTALWLIGAVVLYAISATGQTVYEGKATVRILFPEQAGKIYTRDALQALTFTHTKIVGSKPVLYQVIDNLLLTLSWRDRSDLQQGALTREKALAKLRDNMTITAVSNTVGLIEIRFRSSDSFEAAMVANEIAGSYRKFANELPEQVGGAKVVVLDPAEPSKPPVEVNSPTNKTLNKSLKATGKPAP